MKRNKKQIKQQKTGKIVKRTFQVVGTLFLVGFLSLLIFACIFAAYVRHDFSKQVDVTLQDFTLDQTSIIYCQDRETGEWVELQKLYDQENRIWASYDEIPKDLINACIAIEDKRFYEHQGVDWVTTGKASVKLFLGKGSAGGSTITQQLIKNLTGDQEITVRRKFTEIFRALDYEKTHSKQQILEMYLNVIYLGEGCNGVRSASQVYFGKDVSQLTLAECASLIGITNNPSIYDPYLNPEKNRERQLIILGQMLEQEMISRAEYDAAVAQEMVFTSGDKEEDEDDSIYYSYFVDQVIRDVIADLAEQGGFSESLAETMLYCGGYSIYCTMDPEIQSAMESVYEDLSNIPKTTSSQQLQSAMVVIDNLSGDIVGIVGGVGEKSGSLTLSRATQSMRSPGSTIKPITVYSPALDAGLITPATVYDDTPFSFEDGKGYPKNQNGRYQGLTTVNSAVGQSLNTVAIKVVDELTPQYSYEFAKEKMGLRTLVADVEINGKTFTDAALAPMSMGGLTRGVTVRDMTNAYATLANSGYYRSARTYTRVMDGDTVILDNEQEKHTAMKSDAAWYMTYMLQNAVQSGTATPAQMGNMAVAAKTGTTSSNHDRWFAAYTPYYTGAVWVGFDEPEEVILTSSSTNPALSLWKKVMTPIHEGLSAKQFPKPENVKSVSYCRDSGLLATEACEADPRGSRVISGLLFQQDVPTKECDVHVSVEICGVSGRPVTEYCTMYAGNELKAVGLLSVSRAFPMPGVVVEDQQYAVPQTNGELATDYFLPQVDEDALYSTFCQEHTEPPLPEVSVEPAVPELPESTEPTPPADVQPEATGE